MWRIGFVVSLIEEAEQLIRRYEAKYMPKKQPVNAMTSKASNHSFGAMIRLERESTAEGLRGASECIGIGHATLSRVERGFMPDLPTFVRICRYYSIDLKKALAMLVD